MTLPPAPFPLQIEHSSGTDVEECIECRLEPLGGPGAIRFTFNTRRGYQNPEERIWLVSAKGRKCPARLAWDCAYGMSGENTIGLIAVLPADWFE